MTKRVLLVDDDVSLCELLTEFLQGDGFEVTSLHDGAQALTLLGRGCVDALVLDIMMPQMSGLEVLKSLRATSQVPVIMLTGRGDEIDRIVGLELGADDYLGKPCNPRELAARLRAVLRRSASVAAASMAEPDNTCGITLGPIHLNKATLEATFNGQRVTLTGAEFHVLLTLLTSAGQVLSKELLTREALHRELAQYDRSIDVHVSRIRHKLAASGLTGDVIRSVRGAGYQLLAPFGGTD